MAETEKGPEACRGERGGPSIEPRVGDGPCVPPQSAPAEIPALIGDRSLPYQSMARTPLVGYHGGIVGHMTATPALLVHQDGSTGAEHLEAMPIRELLAVFARAATLLRSGSPDGWSAETHAHAVCLTSGLPLAMVRAWTIGVLPDALERMDAVIQSQIGVPIDSLDRGWYEAGERTIGLVPRTARAGFVMPGNHPATHISWLTALSAKIPVLVRPSALDVFTPYRLLTALRAAGLPEGAASFVPGGHELAEAVVAATARSVVFGGETLRRRYAGLSHVQLHGPGRSKALVCADAAAETVVDPLARLILDDGGRGCINASAVVVEGPPAKARALGEAVAARLRAVPPLPPLDPAARLASAASEAEALAHDQIIRAAIGQGAVDLSGHGDEPRIAHVGGAHILRPTVLLVDDPGARIFGTELPFPFVVFSPSSSRLLSLRVCASSLAVVIFGGDGDADSLPTQLLRLPGVRKVYAGGALSTEFDPLEPHEGYILDFLLEKKAYRRAVAPR